MECQCGRYAIELTTLPDGTKIYYCFECHRLWGERLVRFDVDFNLVEHQEGACQSTGLDSGPVPVLSGDGLSLPTNGGGPV
jgi:hypothetical protein